MHPTGAYVSYMAYLLDRVWYTAVKTAFPLPLWGLRISRHWSSTSRPPVVKDTTMTTCKLLAYVVDDESVIASTVAMILEHKGFDAKPFTNPVAALAATYLNAPDLLISDVVMPELSGVDLAIQVKRQCPDCKVLLFSGQAATSDLLREAQALGHHFQVLAKPVHPTDLLKSIQNMIEVTPA